MTHGELVALVGVIVLLLAIVFADEWFNSRDQPPPYYPLE